MYGSLYKKQIKKQIRKQKTKKTKIKYIGLNIYLITIKVHFVFKDNILTIYFYNVQKDDKSLSYLENNDMKTDNDQVLLISIS